MQSQSIVTVIFMTFVINHRSSLLLATPYTAAPLN